MLDPSLVPVINVDCACADGRADHEDPRAQQDHEQKGGPVQGEAASGIASVTTLRGFVLGKEYPAKK